MNGWLIDVGTRRECISPAFPFNVHHFLCIMWAICEAKARQRYMSVNYEIGLQLLYQFKHHTC